MAISFDTSAQGTSTPLSYTVGLGNNPILIVGVHSANVPSGVTYNGVAMINLNSVNDVVWGSLWYLLNPIQNSAQNIVLTGAGGITRIAAASYLGASGASLASSETNSGFSTGGGLVMNTTSGLWGVGMLYTQNSTGITATNQSTARQTFSGMWVDTNGVSNSAAQLSINWVNSVNWLMNGGNIIPTVVYTTNPTQGSYSLTGESIVLSKFHQYLMSVVTGMYTLTGIATSFIHKLNPWNKQSKSSNPTYSHQAKNSASFTKTNRSTTVWTKSNKS